MKNYCESCLKADVCCLHADYQQTLTRIDGMYINPAFHTIVKCGCYREDTVTNLVRVASQASYTPKPGVTESSVMECTSHT